MRSRHWFAALFLFVSVTACALAENPYSVYVMKPDGSRLRKLAHADEHTVHESPRWSHDGNRVVFAARNANAPGYECFVVNVDGTGLRSLGPGNNPDWSPDDKQIAYDLPGPQGMQIRMRTLDGRGDEQIAQGSCPRWSPDGSQIAFANGSMLHVLDVASGEQRALFQTAFATLYRGCCWSPDGKYLAISARPMPRLRRHVILVSWLGEEHGQTVRLQNEAGGQMAFSPDGKQLAFGNAYFINIVDVERKGQPRVLPGQESQNLSPDWSPDGQWIVFISNRK